MSASPSLGHRPCPLLGRVAPSIPLPHAPAPWQLRQCVETGLVYLDNPPPSEVLVSELAWEVSWQGEATRRAKAEPVRYRASRLVKRLRVKMRRNKVRDLTLALVAQMLAKPLKILDLGCGGGELLEDIMQRLHGAGSLQGEPLGIDISRALAEAANRRLAVHGGRCIHAPALQGLATLPAASLDVIILSSFLEHEVEPLTLLKACRERLGGQGRMVIKVPNFNSLNRRLRGARWCGFRWPDHVNYFTPETLRKMAEAAGLRVVRMKLSDRQPLSDSMYGVLARA
jgi:2-polyprenyl-3-methyl-5-hydroxy-6-metoxy-1,4-benzoquinol methylase